MFLFRNAFRLLQCGTAGCCRVRLCQPVLRCELRRSLCSANGLESLPPTRELIKTLAQPYKSHISLSELRDGEAAGLYRRGTVRVNPKKYDESYITSPDGGSDVLLDGLYARNRALDGDVVAYRVFPRTKWKVIDKWSSTSMKENVSTDNKELSASVKDSSFLMPTAVVVAIVEKLHGRVAIGRVVMFDKTSNKVLFSPRDHRIPRMLLPLADFPEDFVIKFSVYSSMLFAAKITDWAEDAIFATGTLKQTLGSRGDVEAETKAILIESHIKDSPFSEEAVSELPELPYTIPEEEIEKRRDLRNLVAFTVDPERSRDLDDALHWRALPDGNFEIGVHIADVSHFVKEGGQLDQEAATRLTSTYLVQRVIPMLPAGLSEELCSLTPDSDRLTVSIIWTVDKQFQIVGEWVGRTVICSKAKLAYKAVQEIFDNSERDWKADFLETEEAYVQPILQSLLELRQFAKFLREERLANGALSIKRQERFAFILNCEGLPVGCETLQHSESRFFVEELMLLANIAIANRLHSTLPEKALLRIHPSPLQVKLNNVVEFGKLMQVYINPHSSKTIQESLEKICDGTELSTIKQLVFKERVLYAMETAKYISAGQFIAAEQNQQRVRLLHYGLAVPLYTHFTSPIRRYADLIVHRQLMSLLGDRETFKMSVGELISLCDQMNIQKLRAKRASDHSDELFFRIYVKLLGMLEEEAYVINVLDRSFDVLLAGDHRATGRIYLNHLPLESYSAMYKTLGLTWKLSTTDGVSESADVEAASGESAQQNQTIRMFDSVRVIINVVDRRDSPFSLVYLLKPPPGCSSDFILDHEDRRMK